MVVEAYIEDFKHTRILQARPGKNESGGRRINISCSGLGRQSGRATMEKSVLLAALLPISIGSICGLTMKLLQILLVLEKLFVKRIDHNNLIILSGIWEYRHFILIIKKLVLHETQLADIGLPDGKSYLFQNDKHHYNIH